MHLWKLAAGFYACGVLAHFSHNLAFDLSSSRVTYPVIEALANAPVSLVWPADLINTLI